MGLGLLATVACNRGPKTPELVSGVVFEDMDTTVNPCENFYDYATLGWRKANPLDAEHSSYGAFDVLAENNQKNMRTLIDSLVASENAKGSDAEKIVTLYNIGMDSARLQKQGAEPIKPYMEEIAGLKDRQQLVSEMTRLHKIGMFPFFGMFSEADYTDASMTIAWIFQAGTGMGDRDYYLAKGADKDEMRAAYVKLMTDEFALAGYDKLSGLSAADLAKKVMALETRLAKAQYDKIMMRDPYKTFHKMTIEEANKAVKGFDFGQYFTNMGAANVKNFNLAQPEYMNEIAKILATENIETVKAYYAWNVINTAASYLSDDFVNANFAFYGTAMSGIEQMKPRWKRVTNTLNGAMGEALGKLYVERYFPAEAKARMETLVGNLQDAFAKRIEGAAWMSDTTKTIALEKLHAIYVKVGYPNKWRDYSTLKIEDDNYFANIIRSNEFDMAYMLSKIDKPTDKDEWGMTPQTVNAYYNPTTNEICFPAAILQPPFFNMNADDAVNYGAIGVVIGHEMTHGFDDQGRQYDLNGNLHDWWLPSDAENFKNNAQVLIDCFNGVKVLDDPETYANGELCLGENIADNGGLHISYQAMMTAIEKGQVNAEEMDGFTPAQRFFLAYARVWANNVNDKYRLMLTMSDVHSLAENRVNVTLPHITEFIDAWGIKEGDAMYLAPEKRVVLW